MLRSITRKLRNDERGFIDGVLFPVFMIFVIAAVTVAGTFVLAAATHDREKLDDAFSRHASSEYGVDLTDDQVFDLTHESKRHERQEVSVSVDGTKYTVHAVRDEDDEWILVLPDGTELPQK